LPAFPAGGHQDFFLGFHASPFSEAHREFFRPQSLQDSVFKPELKAQQLRSHRHGSDVSGRLLYSRDRASDDQFMFSGKRFSKDSERCGVNAWQSAEQQIPDRYGILKRLRGHVCITYAPGYVPVPFVRGSRNPIALRGIALQFQSQQTKRCAGQISKSHVNPLRANESTDLGQLPNHSHG
jgi:hypothetical protein